jgi:ionotropic glutamate receptor
LSGCQLIGAGISALFATGIDLSLESHLKSLSFALDLPLILPTSSAHEPASESSYAHASFPTKLAPSKTILGEALKDAVNFFNWTRVALLYEEHDGKVI